MQSFRGVIRQGRLTTSALIAVLFIATLTAGCIGLAGGKALTDSAPVANPVTASGATITWNTNLPTTSEVEYGTSSAYGSATPVDTTMVTSHSVVLSGLNSGTTYHFAVQSREADGTAITTGDQVFTTLSGSGTPPEISVSITSPASGASVSGTLTVSASASASNGATISSVQFQLEGVNLSAATSSAPYSTTWNTSSSSNGSHLLTAIATDSSRGTATSAAIPVTVSNGNTALPTVQVTAPAFNSTVNGTVTLSASASANDGGTISHVQFRVDNVNVGSPVTSAPYSISWNSSTVSNGAHYISANAVDSNGQNNTSQNDPITVSDNSNTAPTVSITAPTGGSTVSGTVTVRATAAGTNGATISKVQFQVNGANVGSADTTTPYKASWNTSSLTNGSYTLTAVATDSNNETATSTGVTVTVSNSTSTPPPTVSISSPANGASVNGTVTVNATAAAASGATISQVQLQVDGANVGSADTSLPYNFSWNSASVSNGSHTLRAVATDSNNASTTSATVTVTVNNVSSTPPTTSVSSPASGASVSGTVTVSASASAASGATISKVQLQVDTANVGSADTSSPYNFSWNTSSVSNGSHSLRVLATDSNNLSTTSAAVSVTVNNVSSTPPTVSISSPASGATVSGTVSVSASASATSGATISKVQFQVDGNNVGAADTATPYSFSWSTTSYANGGHTLTAVATDSNNNSTTSSPVDVSVSNSSGGGGSIPSTLGWWDSPSSTQAAVCPSGQLGSTGCKSVISAWSGGAADTAGSRLFWTGGGHSDYSGNEVYAYSLATNSTTVYLQPTNPPEPETYCGSANSDGRPAARHTYGGMVYAANVNSIWLSAGVPWCDNGGTNARDVWLLNLSTGKYTNMLANATCVGLASGCSSFAEARFEGAAYDPNSGLIYAEGHTTGTYTYDPKNNILSLIDANDFGVDYESGVVDPGRGLFITMGAGTINTMVIGKTGLTSNGFTQATPSSCSVPDSSEAPGLAYDPNQQLIVIYPQSGNTVYTYNPDSQTCSAVTFSGGPGSTNENGMWGRFGYFPAYGVFATVNEYDHDVYTLRLTAGGGGGTSGGSGSNVAISNVSASNITTNSATVTWTTSVAATSQVKYGTTSSLPNATSMSSSMVTNHSQSLSGLAANTLYYFAATSSASNNTATSTTATFGTTNTTDNTPPTVSISAPTSGSSVSGTVTLSANASDNVGVASVQFTVDGSNVGALDTASPYTTAWDSTSVANGTHSISAVAKDTAGNTTTAAAITVSVSNTNSNSNANADYQARCNAPGVVRCIGFDTASDITGKIQSDATGTLFPTLDTTTAASGASSLKFTVPALSSANTSGNFATDFLDDHSAQFDSLINGDPASKTNACGGQPCTNEFWIQWRQRFSPEMMQQFAGSNGFKQAIIGEGDAAKIAYSCTDMELVLENSEMLGMPRVYHSCGVKLGEYDPLETPVPPYDWSPQNMAGGYVQCTKSSGVAPTFPPCIPYVANQWMTFQLHVKVGTWYPGGGSASNPPGTFVHDSTVQLYVAQEGQPSQLAVDYHPGATSASCDATQSDIPACQTGIDLTNPSAFPVPTGSPSSYGNVHAKYGKIWLLPYQTDKDGTVSQAAAATWYDELIISRQRIADPKF